MPTAQQLEVRVGEVIRMGIPKFQYDGKVMRGPTSLKMQDGPRVQILEISPDPTGTKIKFLDDHADIVNGRPAKPKEYGGTHFRARGTETYIHAQFNGFYRD